MTRRPDKHEPSTLRDLSQAVHAGNVVDSGTGAVRTPIVMANSYALPEDPRSISWSSAEATIYTRNGAANQKLLQQKLALLDHAEDSVVLASGVAALHAVFCTSLRTGDHAVIADQTYEASFRLFDELLPEKYGIESTFVDTSDLEAV